MAENSALDWNTLLFFTQGLIEVAKADGIDPRERQYIEAFFNEETAFMYDKKEIDFEKLVESPLYIDEMNNYLNTDELKEYFLKTCVMLACVDNNFSEDERKLIKQFSDVLSISQEKLNSIITEVQQEYLSQFSDISIYKDSLKEIAENIGVKDYIINEK